MANSLGYQPQVHPPTPPPKKKKTMSTLTINFYDHGGDTTTQFSSTISQDCFANNNTEKW